VTVAAAALWPSANTALACVCLLQDYSTAFADNKFDLAIDCLPGKLSPEGCGTAAPISTVEATVPILPPSKVVLCATLGY